MSNPSLGDALRETVLGVRVENTVAHVADIDLFTVTGEVLITLLYGIITGVCDAGVTTILLEEKSSSENLCAATTVTDDAVGEIYRVTGDPDIILNGTGSTPTLHVCGLLSAFPATGGILFDGGTGLTIELTQTGADATGAVKWVMLYLPLEKGANVVAA